MLLYKVGKPHLILLFILVTAAFLRFYKLDWGDGFFFHPDEYHIAASVTQLSFPGQMHPHFFAYGTFTSYLIYFTKTLLPNWFDKYGAFGQAILIGRFFSACWATLTVGLVYLIAQRLFHLRSVALTAAVIAAAMPGLIQQAHFTTPESGLIFFLLMFLYAMIGFIQTGKERWLYAGAIILGLSWGIKISGFYLWPVEVATVFLAGCARSKKRWRRWLTIAKRIGLAVTLNVVSFIAVFPYALIDWKGFISTSRYESGIATGQNAVFYTRSFLDTTPFWFQVKQIYLYAAGPVVTAAALFGLIWVIRGIREIKKRKKKTKASELVLVLAFFCLYLPAGLLYAKWTRFSAPLFPLMALFGGYFLGRAIVLEKVWAGRVLIGILLAANFIWTIMCFSVYRRPDVRVAATEWINGSLPSGSKIMVEGGNMLDVPLFGKGYPRASLDFYNIDGNRTNQGKILTALAESDYFIIQSRRVFMNHKAHRFPQTARFYDELFNGQLGFQEIQKMDSFPRLNLGNFVWTIPDEQAEETWSVFDHPVVRIYAKSNRFTAADYRRILGWQ